MPPVRAKDQRSTLRARLDVQPEIPAAGRGMHRAIPQKAAAKKKRFQVTRFAASLSASMPGTELRIPECRTLSPFRSPQAVFSGLRINASRRAAAFSFTGPVARNGLSLARNDSRFHGLHSGVNVPGLLLRSLLGNSQVRSAFRSAADFGLHPLSAASSREPVTCSLRRSVCSLSGLRSPFGSFTSLVDHSVLPDSAPTSPPSDSARFPFAPRFPFLSLVRGSGSSFPVRYFLGGSLFLKPLGTTFTMRPNVLRVNGETSRNAPISSAFNSFIISPVTNL